MSVEYDAGLFEELRALRRRLADAQDVPAFIVFGDVALRHMASSRPRTLEAFGHVPGVGRAKLEAYGAAFVEAISGYADAHGLAGTEELLEATDRPASGRRASTQDATREMLSRGLSVAAIARERGISSKTVLGHIERMDHRGETLEVSHLQLAPERMSLVEEAIAQCGERVPAAAVGVPGVGVQLRRDSHRAGVPSAAGAGCGGVGGLRLGGYRFSRRG